MKNILAFYRPLKGVLVFALLGILMLTGCNDLVSPPAAKTGAIAGLQISISGTGTGARTLFPDYNFVEYVLSFDYEDASEFHADVTIPGNAPSEFITGLADGEWTITARGYVNIGGSLHPDPAAEGSETIIVDSGTFQSLAISIEPSRTPGENGFFTWSVSLPSSVEVAELSLYGYKGSLSPLYSYDLLDTPEDSKAIPPGFYVMSIEMETAEASKTRSELIHIYSNMETRAVYEFTEDDFAKFITISGTLNISGNKEPLEWLELTAWLDDNYDNNFDWEFDVDLDAKTWSARIPAFDEEYTFYLGLECGDDYDYYFANIPLTVKNEDISDIVLDFVFITLSGTVTVDDSVDYIELEVYLDEDRDYWWGYVEIDPDDLTWEITGSGFPTDTTLYFWVYGEDFNDDSFYTEAASFTVNNADVANIELNVYTKMIELSGEITVTGDAPWTIIEIAFGTFETGGDIDTVTLINTLDDGSYSFDMRPFGKSTKVYVSAYVHFENSLSLMDLGTIDVYNSDISGLDFIVDLSTLTPISGTVDYSGPFVSMSVDIYKDAEQTVYLGSATVANLAKTWTAYIPVFETETSLYISLSVLNNDEWIDYGAGSIVVGGSISDFDLVPESGVINSKYITISGTLTSTITASRATVYANAYDDSWDTDINYSFPSTRTWTIQIPRFSGKKAISFSISYLVSGDWINAPPTNKRIILTGNDVSGIALTF